MKKHTSKTICNGEELKLSLEDLKQGKIFTLTTFIKITLEILSKAVSTEIKGNQIGKKK